MDDQYGGDIYEFLNGCNLNLKYPIKTNISSPLPFLDKVKDGDIILLDNFFPWETREEPLWDEFLGKYLNLWLSCKIICISDYGKALIDRYVNRDIAYKKWDIAWWETSKDWERIESRLIKLLN